MASSGHLVMPATEISICARARECTKLAFYATCAVACVCSVHSMQVNVAIRRNVPGAGRSTFAPRDFHKGEAAGRVWCACRDDRAAEQSAPKALQTQEYTAAQHGVLRMAHCIAQITPCFVDRPAHSSFKRPHRLALTLWSCSLQAQNWSSSSSTIFADCVGLTEWGSLCCCCCCCR